MNANKTPARKQFTIAFHRKVTVLCLLTFPLLLSLGIWQLQRAEEKRERQAELEAVQAMPPQSLPGADPAQLAEHRRLILTGRYWQGRNWLLDNRQRDAQVGFEVVSPFELSDGTVLLVNRGWVAGEPDRSALPNPGVPEGEVTLFGDWWSPSEHPLLEGEPAGDGWPKVILAIAPQVMADTLGEPLYGHYVKLDDGSPGALTTDWQQYEISAAKHLGYAVQWFAMALAVVLWFVLTTTKRWHPWRGKDDNDGA
ncbi:SURF1 family protein [Marinimicrobium agarilyticum]|uniref:SURF1 family protein n=1 Tax=Marinimicrobium agarilyticum TaxID=306546 RepID=UPI00041A98A8|nr:SURF1 family protein [Marinimicrobium agarilyticum]